MSRFRCRYLKRLYHDWLQSKWFTWIALFVICSIYPDATIWHIRINCVYDSIINWNTTIRQSYPDNAVYIHEVVLPGQDDNSANGYLLRCLNLMGGFSQMDDVYSSTLSKRLSFSRCFMTNALCFQRQCGICALKFDDAFKTQIYLQPATNELIYIWRQCKAAIVWQYICLYPHYTAF